LETRDEWTFWPSNNILVSKMMTTNVCITTMRNEVARNADHFICDDASASITTACSDEDNSSATSEFRKEEAPVIDWMIRRPEEEVVFQTDSESSSSSSSEEGNQISISDPGDGLEDDLEEEEPVNLRNQNQHIGDDPSHAESFENKEDPEEALVEEIENPFELLEGERKRRREAEEIDAPAKRKAAALEAMSAKKLEEERMQREDEAKALLEVKKL
jgi:hypothetical protein